MFIKGFASRYATCLIACVTVITVISPSAFGNNSQFLHGDYNCSQFYLGQISFFGTVTLNNDGTYAVYEAKPSGKYEYDGRKIHWRTGPLSETADSSPYKLMGKSAVFTLFVSPGKGDRKVEWSCERSSKK